MTQTTYTKSLFNILNNTTETPTDIKMSSPMKISKKPNSAFSLPAGKDFSCIGETSACAKDCYARKGNHFRHGVQKNFLNNFLFLKEAEKNNDAQLAVDTILKHIPENAALMRIHESGDFYSQWYVNVWEQVAIARPQTKFWFYTRSFDLDFSSISQLDNMACWASTDGENLKKAEEFVSANKQFRHAYGPINDEDEVPENTVICPATSGRLNVAGACSVCKLCVDKTKFKKHIGFKKH